MSDSRNPIDCSPPGSSVREVLQEYWSGLAFPSPGDLPDPGIKPRSPALQADALPSEPKRLANIYSQSIVCFFVFLTVSFEKHF